VVALYFHFDRITINHVVMAEALNHRSYRQAKATRRNE
jgi:hypothetical protein